MALRDAKPGLKIILSLGGSNAGWPAFLSVSRFYMPEFVNNVTAHLRENGFDGLEVDWEFPFNMMSHFTTLIQVVLSSKLNLEELHFFHKNHGDQRFFFNLKSS